MILQKIRRRKRETADGGTSRVETNDGEGK